MQDGSDELDLSAFGFATFAKGQALARKSAAGELRLVVGGGDVLFVDNFAKASFDAAT